MILALLKYVRLCVCLCLCVYTCNCPCVSECLCVFCDDLATRNSYYITILTSEERGGGRQVYFT